MDFFGTSLGDVREKHIHALLVTKPRESLRVEYKDRIPGKKAAEGYVTVAKQVAAFANAEGGHIVLGVREQGGEPVAAEGIEVEDVDQLILQLQQAVSARADPPVPSVRFHPVEMGPGRYVLIIAVPQSWTRPHQVDHQFPLRREAGKEPMRTSEVRTAIALADVAMSEAHRFREERLQAVMNGEVSYPLAPKPTIVFHVIPLAFSSPTHRIELGDEEAVRQAATPCYLDFSDRGRYNLDGYTASTRQPSRVVGEEGPIRGYTQLFRSGAIESACTGIAAPRGNDLPPEYLALLFVTLEQKLQRAYDRYTAFLAASGAELPLLLGVSLLHARHLYIETLLEWDYRNINEVSIERSRVVIPFELLDRYDKPAYEAMGPIFHSIWQACGAPRALSMNDDGTFTHQRR